MTSTARIYYAPSKEQLDILCRKEELKEKIYERQINPELFTSVKLFSEYMELKRELETL